MSNQVLQIGVGTQGISFSEFSSEYLLKDEAAAHSCGDVKCGGSMPF